MSDIGMLSVYHECCKYCQSKNTDSYLKTRRQKAEGGVIREDYIKIICNNCLRIYEKAI